MGKSLIPSVSLLTAESECGLRIADLLTPLRGTLLTQLTVIPADGLHDGERESSNPHIVALANARRGA